VNHILASVPIEDRCPRNQPDGAHSFKRSAFLESGIRCRYCGVKQQAAGDPAPTNPTAPVEPSERDQLMFMMLHGGAATNSIAAWRVDRFASEVREQARAEVLAEAIEAARGEYLTDNTGTDEVIAYNNGITDAVAAISALLDGGESR